MGERLEAKGFYKWGGETMVSGITGEEFQVDIYIGIVYYQRCACRWMDTVPPADGMLPGSSGHVVVVGAATPNLGCLVT